MIKWFDIFSYSDTIFESYRQTDRQTRGITYTVLASCGKNEQSAKLKVNERHLSGSDS